MNRQESIINLSAIFNRGSSTDAETSFFENKKHDELLDLLLQYIQNSSSLIGNPKIYKTQALNDHGVDLIVEFPNGQKIGIQIKSHFDVTETDFAIKVKAQLAESQFHGVDKWYLLICSPLTNKKRDYSSKVSHLINELSGYKSTYHIVYSPQQCTNIFNSPIMSETEFHLLKTQFIFEPVDWGQLINEIEANKTTSGYLSKIEVQNETKSITAELYLKHCNLVEDDREYILESLEELQLLLKQLSKPTREFLFAVLQRANKKDSMRDSILTSCQDIENYLGIDSEKVKKEVAILENLGIAEFDDDFESGIWYIAIRRINPDYNILDDIKTYCKVHKKDLKNIIVDLNFSLFDE